MTSVMHPGVRCRRGALKTHLSSRYARADSTAQRECADIWLARGLDAIVVALERIRCSSPHVHGVDGTGNVTSSKKVKSAPHPPAHAARPPGLNPVNTDESSSSEEETIQRVSVGKSTYRYVVWLSCTLRYRYPRMQLGKLQLEGLRSSLLEGSRSPHTMMTARKENRV
ncbi:hypothetical protein OH77DRAFT_1419250 [Trametes cingulata]|nr:hypothetical protein OH77DRAFT_1419250 [Trametes cingulata]